MLLLNTIFNGRHRMKEPKKYKLSENFSSQKEPIKLPLKSVFVEDFEELLEKKYDCYKSNTDSTYVNKDLVDLKTKNKA